MDDATNQERSKPLIQNQKSVQSVVHTWMRSLLRSAITSTYFGFLPRSKTT